MNHKERNKIRTMAIKVKTGRLRRTKENTNTVNTTRERKLNNEKPKKKAVSGKTLVRKLEEGWKQQKKTQEMLKEKGNKRPKGFLYRHASTVTFSLHATGPVIYACCVSMTTHARKHLGAEAVPKDAKTRKGPTMQT